MSRKRYDRVPYTRYKRNADMVHDYLVSHGLVVQYSQVVHALVRGTMLRLLAAHNRAASGGEMQENDFVDLWERATDFARCAKT